MRLKVTADTMSPNSVRVWLDELEITKSCRGLEVVFEKDEMNSATIRIFPDELVVNGEILALLEAFMPGPD